MVTPIGTVVTAKTGDQKVVNRSWGIFAIGQGVKDNFYSLILQSNSQESFCRHKFWYGQTVKSLFAVWSSSKNDGLNFLTP